MLALEPVAVFGEGEHLEPALQGEWSPREHGSIEPLRRFHVVGVEAVEVRRAADRGSARWV
jgi:hypothetical protein